MRLSTYSWLVVVVAAAVAAVGWLGLAGWIAVAVLLASVGMHVAGNAIGTGLRDRADRELARPSAHRADMPLPAHTPGRLERSESLGRLVPVSAIIGGLIGGATGTASLVLFARSSVAGGILGGCSSAVIGGFLGFLLASVVTIFRASLQDAIAAQEADRRPETRAEIASNGPIDLVRYPEDPRNRPGDSPP